MSGLAMTPVRRQLLDAATRICADFDDDYWLKCDNEHAWPTAFHEAAKQAGWMGITIPEEYGGSGLGVTEAALLMQVLGGSAGALAACGAIQASIFGPQAVVVHGTQEQRERMLPRLATGEDQSCNAITEPDSGLDTPSINTRAVLKGDRYIVNGQKVWTSTAQTSNKMMLLARTTPLDQCRRSIDGMTLFYTDFDRSRIQVREIEKLGRAAVDSNSVFIENLEVPVEDRIGAEGQGFKALLDSVNPERVIIGAEMVGLGRRALAKATEYAKQRVVFGRPIGKNQGIQHPLAESWMELEAADLMVWRAAELYDTQQPCGPEASAAKYLAAEACFRACDRALRTHGGFGYAKEYHVERYFRESVLFRVAPVSRELVLCFVAEKVLGLPKSY